MYVPCNASYWVWTYDPCRVRTNDPGYVRTNNPWYGRMVHSMRLNNPGYVWIIQGTYEWSRVRTNDPCKVRTNDPCMVRTNDPWPGWIIQGTDEWSVVRTIGAGYADEWYRVRVNDPGYGRMVHAGHRRMIQGMEFHLKTEVFRKAYTPASENYWRVNLLSLSLSRMSALPRHSVNPRP